jgi:hypothetical protein
MKRIQAMAVCALMAAVQLVAANQTRTFNGVITCTMCSKDHKAMGITPDEKCVRECIKHDNSKYALNEGGNVYILSDQQTPEKFAGKKVAVKGTLYEKTKILKVDSIALAK